MKGDNVHKGHRERFRKRYLYYGLSSFEDHEVLELLLYYCVKVQNTNELAHRLINEYGSLMQLFTADPMEVMKRCRLSDGTAVLISLIPHLAQRYFVGEVKSGIPLIDSERAGQYALSLFTGKRVECFFIICLDTQRRLIHSALVSEGTINEAQVYTRKVVEAALRYGAASVILTHNHPGGLLDATAEDIDATQSIIQAFTPIAIEVSDHIIVAKNKYISMQELGLMPY